MIEIDFNRYSVEELRSLNHRLVDHLRLRNQRSSQERMNKFELGQRVCFETNDGDIVEGKIIRFNQKTVTIEKDCGHQWRVAPQFLQEVVSARSNTIEVLPSNAGGGSKIDQMLRELGKNISRNAPCPCGSGKKFKRCHAPQLGLA